MSIKFKQKFLVFDTFFLLNSRKIRKFENNAIANQHKIDTCTKRYNISAIHEQHGTIKFAIKELDLSKLLINLIYCSIYHGYYVVILVLTFHEIR